MVHFQSIPGKSPRRFRAFFRIERTTQSQAILFCHDPGVIRQALYVLRSCLHVFSSCARFHPGRVIDHTATIQQTRPPCQPTPAIFFQLFFEANSTAQHRTQNPAPSTPAPRGSVFPVPGSRFPVPGSTVTSAQGAGFTGSQGGG